MVMPLSGERSEVNPSASEGEVSSSSSEAERLLRRAIDVLQAEAPDHGRLFAATLGALVVELEIGDERVSLAGEDEAIVLRAGAVNGADVRVHASLRTALALIRGETSALEAIRSRTLAVFGEVSKIARTTRAMEVFVHGMVRCPNGSAVVDDLQRMVEAA
ncbi:MAG: hypothetical protein KF764_05690 [Labilithrix sp.]|nr:hypothetical protein [Labilithrix sp.]